MEIINPDGHRPVSFEDHQMAEILGQAVVADAAAGFDTIEETDAIARENALAQARMEALDEIFQGEPLPADCEVTWTYPVPQSGTEPLVKPVFKRPGYRAAIIRTQDNNRPAGSRVVRSLRWERVVVDGAFSNRPA